MAIDACVTFGVARSTWAEATRPVSEIVRPLMLSLMRSLPR